MLASPCPQASLEMHPTGIERTDSNPSPYLRQIAALAVTVPGVIYLRRGDTPKPGHDSQRGQATIEAAHEAKWSKTEPATDTSGKDAAEQHSEETEQGKVEESKTDEAVEHQGEADDSASASSSESDAAATPSGSAEGQPKAMDDSGENVSTRQTPKLRLLLTRSVASSEADRQGSLSAS